MGDRGIAHVKVQKRKKQNILFDPEIIEIILFTAISIAPVITIPVTIKTIFSTSRSSCKIVFNVYMTILLARIYFLSFGHNVLARDPKKFHPL